MNSITAIQQWAEDLSNKSDDCKIKALTEALGAVSRGADLRQLVPSVAKVTSVTKATNPELTSLAYLFLTYVARNDPQALLLAVNALELGATKGSTPMIREQAIRCLGEICIPDIISDIAGFVAKAAEDENAYVRSSAANCISNMFKVDAERAQKAGIFDVLKRMTEDASIDVAITASRCLVRIDKNTTLLDKCVSFLDHLSNASSWSILMLLEVLEEYDLDDLEIAKLVVERLFLLVQHAKSAIVVMSLRILLRTINHFSDKRLQERMITKLIPILITLTLSNEFELRYIILKGLPLVIKAYPDLFSSSIQYFVPCHTDDKEIRLCKLHILFSIANNTNAKDIIIRLGNWVLDETSPGVLRKCIETFGSIAAKLPLFTERILNVLRSILLTLLGGTTDRCADALAELLKYNLMKPLQQESEVETYDNSGSGDNDRLTLFRNVQLIIEETVIQLEMLFRRFPITVLDVLPFFEPLLYVLQTERGIVSALGILITYKAKDLQSMETTIDNLSKRADLAKRSPSFQLMLLQVLIQRYFGLIKDYFNGTAQGATTLPADVVDAAQSLDYVFIALKTEEGDPIVQARIGFYYNIYVMLRQGAHANPPASDMKDILADLEPVLFYDPAAVFKEDAQDDTAQKRASLEQDTQGNYRKNRYAYEIGNCSSIINTDISVYNETTVLL